MKIQMLTTSCGADSRYNFSKGDIRDVTEEEARYWYGAGVCTLIDEFPIKEKAVLKAPNKATITPTETASSWGTAGGKK